MTKPLSIALIGCGNMGGALLRGWLAAGIVETAHVLEPNSINIDNGAVHQYCDAAAFGAARPKADIAVLAVKPQVMEAVCADLKDALRGTPILSIAAGKTLAFFEAIFSAKRPIIRAMPNLPAAIGKGVTGLTANSAAKDEHRAMAQALMKAAGAVEWLGDEALMNALTAVSASGPAYLYYFVEALADAGAAAGLPPDMAMRLARGMVTGSAALAEFDSDTTAAKLRANVTSPNGTTAAALDVLMDGRWKDILSKAVAAAAQRAKELSE